MFEGGDRCDTCPTEEQIGQHVPESTVLPSHFFKTVALRRHDKRVKFCVAVGSLEGKAATRKLLQLFDI